MTCRVVDFLTRVGRSCNPDQLLTISPFSQLSQSFELADRHFDPLIRTLHCVDEWCSFVCSVAEMVLVATWPFERSFRPALPSGPSSRRPLASRTAESGGQRGAVQSPEERIPSLRVTASLTLVRRRCTSLIAIVRAATRRDPESRRTGKSGRSRPPHAPAAPAAAAWPSHLHCSRNVQRGSQRSRSSPAPPHPPRSVGGTAFRKSSSATPLKIRKRGDEENQPSHRQLCVVTVEY